MPKATEGLVQQHLETIISDKILLFIALENILSNSIKYSEPGKIIYLKTLEQANQLNFEIKDEGKGIPPNELNTLFDRYKTTSNRTTAQEQSRGLGLSIVKRICDELGGKIKVKSDTGQCSTFTLSFPV